MFISAAFNSFDVVDVTSRLPLHISYFFADVTNYTHFDHHPKELPSRCVVNGRRFCRISVVGGRYVDVTPLYAPNVYQMVDVTLWTLQRRDKLLHISRFILPNWHPNVYSMVDVSSWTLRHVPFIHFLLSLMDVEEEGMLCWGGSMLLCFIPQAKVYYV